MYEPTISISRLGATVLWALTVTLVVASWLIFPIGYPDLAVMLVSSACISGCGATTLSVRCYAKRYTRILLQGMAEKSGGSAVRNLRP